MAEISEATPIPKARQMNYVRKKGRLGISPGQLIIGVIMFLLAIVTIYPFWYCFVYSFSSADAAAMSNVVFWPVGFTLDNYLTVFRMNMIYSSALISIFRTVAGVLYSVTITGLASYAISKRDLPGNRIITIFLLIPMFISGGLLPYYVTIAHLGLFNNLLVYILPHGFWAFNMLLMRTYFDTIPPDLEESARIDGASDWTIFIKIIVPLSMPIIAVIAMFNGVWQWNSWFDAQLFVTKFELRPLQNILQSLIRENTADLVMLMQGRIEQRTVSAETIRMTTLIVTTLPIIFIYPFFQKHFIRGMMIGAVKA
jgi:putative aldouronate transport system permease protein